MFCAYFDKILGERSQDHWSSGLQCMGIVPILVM